MKTRLLAACMLVLGTASLHAADFRIVQKGRAFHPAQISIAPGQTLTFTNEDSFIHQIYVDGLFDSNEKAPGENLNETFPRAGTFKVRCHIHPTMRMTVQVR
jgi:plastocyanin